MISLLKPFIPLPTSHAQVCTNIISYFFFSLSGLTLGSDHTVQVPLVQYIAAALSKVVTEYVVSYCDSAET